MIQLNNLSTVLAQVDAVSRLDEIGAAAHAVVTVSEPDPENPPVIGPGPHHPGLPAQESIYNALKALREHTVGNGIDPFSAVGLNPQPLPPREMRLQLNNCFAAVALNPQPLPPKESLDGLNRSSLAGRIG